MRSKIRGKLTISTETPWEEMHMKKLIEAYGVEGAQSAEAAFVGERYHLTDDEGYRIRTVDNREIVELTFYFESDWRTFMTGLESATRILGNIMYASEYKRCPAASPLEYVGDI